MITNKAVEKMLIEGKIEYKLCNEEIGHFNLYKNGKYIMSYWSSSEKCHIPSTNFKGVVTLRKLVDLYNNEVDKLNFKEETEILEKESAEIRLKIDKAMEKSMKEMRRADILFAIIHAVLFVMLIVAIWAIINQIITDNELLETYDSCVDVNGERYCRVDD